MKNLTSFRAVLFRMVPKPSQGLVSVAHCFRAVLFRMVPKLLFSLACMDLCFRAVLFRMVPKPVTLQNYGIFGFRAVCFKWFQNTLKATHFSSSFFSYSSLHISRHNPILL